MRLKNETSTGITYFKSKEKFRNNRVRFKKNSENNTKSKIGSQRGNYKGKGSMYGQNKMKTFK